jgi:hypothetical protein
MIGHVTQFGTFGSTAPWVFTLIGFGFAVLAAVHLYTRIRHRRRREKARASRLERQSRPDYLFNVCSFRLGGECSAGYSETEYCEKGPESCKHYKDALLHSREPYDG